MEDKRYNNDTPLQDDDVDDENNGKKQNHRKSKLRALVPVVMRKVAC